MNEPTQFSSKMEIDKKYQETLIHNNKLTNSYHYDSLFKEAYMKNNAIY